MTNSSQIFEIFASCHLLLVIGSLVIGGKWLHAQPTLKLWLTRILLASCLMSPFAVLVMKSSPSIHLAKFSSIEFSITHYQPSYLASMKSESNSATVIPKNQALTNYIVPMLLFILAVTFLWQAYKTFRDLRNLRSLLRNAHHFRSSGRLYIKLSADCQIPFSVRSFTRAYIVLPLGMLNNFSELKMSIAHEGQHHRHWDCLWAYLMESIKFVFFGNPSLRRWQRVINELQELSCDEALVGQQMISPHAYGRCLLRVAQTVTQISKASRHEVACTVGMAWKDGSTKHSFLRRRIYMLSEYQSKTPRRVLWVLTIGSVFVLSPLGMAYAGKGVFSEQAVQSIDISSVDPRIQKIADEEIHAAIKRYRAKSGVIAVANPRTGKVLAFAEASSINGTESWSRRVFPPASTIKPFIAAAAIDAGVSSESQMYDCRQPYDVAGTRFANHDKRFADMSLTDAIAQSANVCLIKVAQDIGSSRLRETLSRFGFDVTSQWQADQSDALQLATIALGETIPTNIGSLLNAYVMLANKGRMSATVPDSVITEATASSVRKMLVEAVKHGTGKRASVLNAEVAGKTGTLSAGNNANGQDLGERQMLGLFAGYAPADSPQFVSVVIIEDGYRPNAQEKAGGGVLAAPVFSTVLQKSFESTHM